MNHSTSTCSIHCGIKAPQNNRVACHQATGRFNLVISAQIAEVMQLSGMHKLQLPMLLLLPLLACPW